MPIIIPANLPAVLLEIFSSISLAFIVALSLNTSIKEFVFEADILAIEFSTRDKQLVSPLDIASFIAEKQL